MSSEEDFIYTGKENLEVLKGVDNYNNFIEKFLIKFMDGEHEAVDFGAGMGDYAKKLSNAGYNVTCIELDEELREHIKSRGMDAYGDLSQSQGVHKRIYTLDVLEHIEDDEQAMKGLFDKLDNDGKLLVYVPAFPILYSAMDKKIGHFRRYQKKELVEKLKKAGFIIESVEYADCLGFFASLVFKYLGNDEGNIDSPLIRVYYKFIFPISRLLDIVFKNVIGKNLLLIAHK